MLIVLRKVVWKEGGEKKRKDKSRIPNQEMLMCTHGFFVLNRASRHISKAHTHRSIIIAIAVFAYSGNELLIRLSVQTYHMCNYGVNNEDFTHNFKVKLTVLFDPFFQPKPSFAKIIPTVEFHCWSNEGRK